jgi:LysM repeat protein
MTRETKIGLLVGLAFIIVIGILLSDHLTSATEPPQAPLAQAGNDVRRGVAVPGGATQPVTQVQIPQVAPTTAVATTQELTPRQPPVTVVQVGPASGLNPPATLPTQVVVGPAQDAQHTSQAQQGQSNQQVAVNDAPVPTTGPSTQLEQIANSLNEPLVPVGQTNNSTQNNTQQLAAGAKQYKAQAGDSLSKMAARFYGTSNKQTMQLILDANPSLKGNPNLIVVGKTYVVPAGAAADSAPVAVQPIPLPNVPKLAENVNIVHETQPVVARPANAPVAQAPGYVYVVKENDTLRKIASAQLGTPDAASAIQELNKLPDGNKIRVGMKLRLPAKPMTAVAQNQ